MSTMYSIGQMNQLGDALEVAGFTPDDVTELRSFSRLGELKDVLKGLAEIVVVKPVQFEFKVFKTIKLGTGLKTADDFRKALKGNRCVVSDRANDILGKPAFTAATEEIEVDLVKATVGELGFKSGARRDQIYDRARELGFKLCSPEVGPQLRLQYKDQLDDEQILIGMEPIPHSDDYSHVFIVERPDSELRLDVHCVNPGAVWISDARWVFVRPRK